ncbi:Na-translocating system protein MpsC family protein [Halobacillus naozhouensis]|uniref:Na-translocating system protein MpsC family protein n=1 Tax=Halobacillus naozhouensis TaxID=554880 RepID=A0ABY8J3Z3_9BACI|nr:Na-translocating system protein MpsC family protein [Halobacillus naozhouensis]WFT75470.1 Na-translocating system protein MpsC family protein [Halobacillus naozhouensis]
MDKKSLQSEVASYIGKLLRDNFGKGPSSVYVSIEEPYITVYLREFLAPMERVLVGQDNGMKVEETRDLMMMELLPEIKATLKHMAGIELGDLFYDWSLTNQSGMFLGVLSNVDEPEGYSDLPDYATKKKIHKEISRVSELAEKVPEKVDSYMLNSRTLLVVRDGILVRIEKELIRNGFGETLKLSKRNLEKTLLRESHCESILGQEVLDVFADWDFEKDKSYILFILKPDKG